MKTVLLTLLLCVAAIAGELVTFEIPIVKVSIENDTILRLATFYSLQNEKEDEFYFPTSWKFRDGNIFIDQTAWPPFINYEYKNKKATVIDPVEIECKVFDISEKGKVKFLRVEKNKTKIHKDFNKIDKDKVEDKIEKEKEKKEK